MEKNYYKILEIDKNASDDEIKKAYRKMAIKWHPDKNSENKEHATEMFKNISEAFQILSDPDKRLIYDQTSNSNFNSPNQYNGPDNIFRTHVNESTWFHTSSSQVFPNMSTNMPFYTHNIPPDLSYLEIKKSDDKIISIDCSLEELYYGCIKKYSLERLIIGRQNGTTKKIKENIEISIKKGYKDGTRITYSKKGDENINKITGDVVFIVKELVHDKYKRFNKNDLMITKDITLSDVTNGFTFSVKCINGVEKDIIINPKEIVNSKCMYKIDGYGMPIRNNGNVLNKCDTEYGNLYVEFNIIFE